MSSSNEPVVEAVAPFTLPEEITKHSVRTSVWEQLENAHLVMFPKPCWGRIPNFKGADQASVQLAQLDLFKSANVVKVNPDKPQEPVRIAVLENRKSLLVPIPRLREGLLNLVVLDEGVTNHDVKMAVRRKGIVEFGKPIDLESKIKIDLVVIGSVAVSKQGYRIGKGEGFADLEFAMMMHMKAVNQDTIVVTTVHDNQVFDELPKELFQPHDVPVDIIVTPTQVFTISKRLPKPTGVIWNILSQRRLDLMPILQKLRVKDQEAGRDVTLREEDSDVETQRRYQPRYHHNRYRYPLQRRQRTSSSRGDKSGEGRDEGGAGEGGARPPRPRRKAPRKYRSAAKKDGGSGEPAENGLDSEVGENGRWRGRKNVHKSRNTIDFSLRVGNIDRTVRVRDLKLALAERGVKPNEITWRGHKGFCVLHFSKPPAGGGRNTTNAENGGGTENATSGGAGDTSVGVDNIIESLQDLKLTPDAEKSLVIEPAKPISRIETINVTSV